MARLTSSPNLSAMNWPTLTSSGCGRALKGSSPARNSPAGERMREAIVGRNFVGPTGVTPDGISTTPRRLDNKTRPGAG